ncbi:MAG: DUF370 domain-containing protein [Oscillospiraceae bacterium]|nr:DUF370 domain-containing protein [Oscillospiraceae bacterium]
MGFLHVGNSVMLPDRRIIGIFDLDNTTTSPRTRAFLQRAEASGVVVDACEDIPRAFLVCDHPYHRQIVYLSQLTPQTLLKRSQETVVTQVEGEKEHV